MSDIQIKLGNQSLVLAENGNVKEFNGKSIVQITHNDFEQIQELLNKASAGEKGIKVKGLNTKDAEGQISFIKNARDGFQKVYSAIIESKALERNAKLNREYIGKANVASKQIGDAKDGIGNGSVSFTKFGADIYSGLVNVFNYESKISDLRNNAGPAAAVVTSNPAISEASHQQCSEAIGGALLSVKTANDAIGLLQGITKQYAMLPISHKTGGKFSNIFTNIASFFKNVCNTIFRNSENTGKVAELVNKVISTKLSGSEAISHAALAGIVMYEAGKKNPDVKVIADCIKHIGGDFKAATKSEDKAAIAESLNVAVSSLRNLKCEAKDCQELSREIKDLAVPMMHDNSTRDYLGLMNVMLKKDNPLSIYQQSSNVNKDVNEFVSNVLKQGSNFINDFDSSFVHSMIKELKPDADSLIKIFGSVREPNDTMQKFLNANSKQLSLSDINTLLNLSGEINHTRAEAAVIQKWPFAREITKLRLDLGVQILDLKNENVHLNKFVFEGKKEIKTVLSLVGKQETLGEGINSLEKKLDDVGSKIANVGADGLAEGEIKALKDEIKGSEEGLKKIKKEQDSIQKEFKKIEKSTDKDMNQMLAIINDEHADDIDIIDNKLNALKDSVDVVAIKLPLPTLPEMPKMDFGRPTMPDDPSIVARVQEQGVQQQQAVAGTVDLNGKPPIFGEQQVEQVEQKKGMSTGKKVAIAVGCVVAVGAAVAGIVYGVRNPEQIAAAGRLIKGYADVAGKAVVGFSGKLLSGAKAGINAVKNEIKSDVDIVKKGYGFIKQIVKPGMPLTEVTAGSVPEAPVESTKVDIKYPRQAEVMASVGRVPDQPIGPKTERETRIEREVFGGIADEIVKQKENDGLLKKVGRFFGNK